MAWEKSVGIGCSRAWVVPGWLGQPHSEEGRWAARRFGTERLWQGVGSVACAESLERSGHAIARIVVIT